MRTRKLPSTVAIVATVALGATCAMTACEGAADTVDPGGICAPVEDDADMRANDVGPPRFWLVAAAARHGCFGDGPHMSMALEWEENTARLVARRAYQFTEEQIAMDLSEAERTALVAEIRDGPSDYSVYAFGVASISEHPSAEAEVRFGHGATETLVLRSDGARIFRIIDGLFAAYPSAWTRHERPLVQGF